MSEEEKQVLKTFKSGLGLTSAEQEILVNYIDKLQKENTELKTKLEIEKTDNLYNKEEANEEMIPKDKIRKEIKELEEMNVSGMLFEIAVIFAKLILKNILEDNK